MSGKKEKEETLHAVVFHNMRHMDSIAIACFRDFEECKSCFLHTHLISEVFADRVFYAHQDHLKEFPFLKAQGLYNDYTAEFTGVRRLEVDVSTQPPTFRNVPFPQVIRMRTQ